MRKNFISSPSPLINPGKKKNTTYVFLAGPIQGVRNWQEEDIPDLGPNITLISPRASEKPESYESQVNWETEGLRTSDYILVWMPLPTEPQEPGRDYGQTTRMEILENLGRGKGSNMVVGIEPGIHGRRYLETKFKYYTGREIHDNLEDTIKELKNMIATRKNTSWFTSDTHFGSQRALELSKRPFKDTKEMDWEMISRWNQVVSPESEVYHLGDFGDYRYLPYLNGKITILEGNYEEDGKDIPPELETLKEMGVTYIKEQPTLIEVGGELIWAAHKPSDLKKACGELPGIFGHIHGRQKVKSWSGVDVGVDAHNFTPLSIEDLNFYLEAIRKHYDSEVWL